MGDMNKATAELTILMKKKKSIPVSEKEILMLLKSYQIHPCSWDKIIDLMKVNMETFPDDTKTLYDNSSNKQLRSRLSTKFGKIITASTENITNDEIKDEVRKVNNLEEKLRRKTVPVEINQQVHMVNALSSDEEQPGPAPRPQVPPPADIQRDNGNHNLAEVNATPVVPAKKAKKRPLMDIIRENQEAYNKFITKKMPKVLRALGVSSDDDSD